MKKRTIIFGDYDTAAHGWTLTHWVLDPAEQKTNFVDVPGADGSLDLSTDLTDGVPKYRDRMLTVTLESSEGTRLEREQVIANFINHYHGKRVDIHLPDDEAHHLNGRLHIVKNYNDPAHASVTITATCKPWKFADVETLVTLVALPTAQTATLVNNGIKPVVPVLYVHTTSADDVILTYDGINMAVSAGTTQVALFELPYGEHEVAYMGAGTMDITYREAVLE